MSARPDPGAFLAPQTLPDALAALAAGGVPVAGATWLMRAPLRHEPLPATMVSLAGVRELQRLEIHEDRVILGAVTTHEALVTALSDAPDMEVLATAAAKSANPGIRRIATLGGNLCAHGFAASDLIPALLCLDAQVALATAAGTELLPMQDFLARRTALDGLVTHVEIARSGRRSAHQRLPMRKAGDYPAAIVSLSADLSGGTITDIRIAVGAVDPVATRWPALEAALRGKPCDPGAAEAVARTLTGVFTGREAVDAPGWYRLSVLPALVRRALTTLQEQ